MMDGRGRVSALQKEGNCRITRHLSKGAVHRLGRMEGGKEKRKCVVLGGDQVGVI